MKKFLLAAAGLCSLLPLACANRPFGTPVRPVLPTATPTTVTVHQVCTITPTPPVTEFTQAGAVTSFAGAQSLGTLAAVDADLDGSLTGAATAIGGEYYSFTAGDSGPGTLYLDCFQTPPTPSLGLYDSSQSLITSGITTSTGNPMVTFTASGGQLYYIAVGGYGGQAYTVKMFLP